MEEKEMEKKKKLLRLFIEAEPNEAGLAFYDRIFDEEEVCE